MAKVTVASYRKDKLYPKVARATACLLKESDEISPVAILLQLGNLTPKDHDSWRRGHVPYLERVFQGSLSKANRILRLLGFHMHDLNMAPSQHAYRQLGTNRPLRFSRSGEAGVEASYARHFRWNQSRQKKQELIARTMSEEVVLAAAPRSEPGRFGAPEGEEHEVRSVVRF